MTFFSKSHCVLRMSVVLFALSVLLSGCSSGHDVTKTAVVRILGIDVNDNGYLVFALTDTFEEESENIVVFESRGKTINEAVEAMRAQSGYELFMKRCEYVVFSCEIREGNFIDCASYLLGCGLVKENLAVAFYEKTARVYVEAVSNMLSPDGASEIFEEDGNYSLRMPLYDVLSYEPLRLKHGFFPVLVLNNEDVTVDRREIFSAQYRQ